MIILSVDQGWGPEHPLKRMEMDIIKRYLRPIQQDDSRTVMINSTWYDGDCHAKTLQQIQTLAPDRIILVSMLDAAIARPDQFDSLAPEIRGVGYYPGPDYIDYWSLVVDQHMTVPDDVLDPSKIDLPFMCLNRKPHWHRLALFNEMTNLDLLDRGLVSMGSETGQAVRLLPLDMGGSDLAPNGGTEQNGIANDIVSLGHPVNWQRHFLNVVTETQYDVTGTTFVTEKIYKPILGRRPFLVYAADGAAGWLEHHGFESYLQDFSDISDLDLSRPSNLAAFLSVLADQGPDYWRKKMIDLQPKISYNQDRFLHHVSSQKQKIDQGISCQT